MARKNIITRTPTENEQLHAIREALNQELVLGRDDFKVKIQQMTKRQVKPGVPGRLRIEDSDNAYQAYVI